MIDKNQIIIDGVDVSKCRFYDEDASIWSCENHEAYHCHNCPDCYYKQLARKEQEYGELKTTCRKFINTLIKMGVYKDE